MKVANTRAAQLLAERVETDGTLDVSESLDVSLSQLYRLIAGDRSPTLPVLQRAEEHYDIPLAAWSQRGLSKSERRRIG
jgi:hypothetical protein